MKIIAIVFGLFIVSTVFLAGCSSDNVKDIDDVSILKDSGYLDKSIESDMANADTGLIDLGELDEIDTSIESDFDDVDSGLIEFGELI